MRGVEVLEGDAGAGEVIQEAGDAGALADYPLMLSRDGCELVFTYDTQARRTDITALLDDLERAGIEFRDLTTTQSSLEDIFVDLVRQQ